MKNYRLFAALAALSMFTVSCVDEFDGYKDSQKFRFNVATSDVATKADAYASAVELGSEILENADFDLGEGNNLMIMVSEAPYMGSPMDFTPATKAEIITTASLSTKRTSFPVEAYTVGQSASSSARFLSENIVYNSAKSSWELASHADVETIKHWPEGDLDFWARSAGDAIIAETAKTANTQSFNFTAPSTRTATATSDVLFAFSSVRNEEVVPIHFHHALAAIKFVAGEGLPENLSIKSVSVNNVLPNGSCNFKPGESTVDAKFAWTASGTKVSYSHDMTGDNASYFTNGGRLFIVPQAIEGTSLTIVITYFGTDYKFNAVLKAPTTWKAGMEYTYTLTTTGPRLGVTVNDNVNSKVKSDLVFTNTGNIDGFFRVSITGNWIGNSLDGVIARWNGKGSGDNDGYSPALPTDEGDANANGWFRRGNYYYYPTAIKAGASIPKSLFDTFTAPATPYVSGARLSMEISAQVVEALEGQTWKDAWGIAQ